MKKIIGKFFLLQLFELINWARWHAQSSTFYFVTSHPRVWGIFCLMTWSAVILKCKDIFVENKKFRLFFVLEVWKCVSSRPEILLKILFPKNTWNFFWVIFFSGLGLEIGLYSWSAVILKCCDNLFLEKYEKFFQADLIMSSLELESVLECFTVFTTQIKCKAK